MKKFSINVVLPGILLLLFISCKKNTNTAVLSLTDGNYTGTFQRQFAGTGSISNIVISFKNGIWHGQSDMIKYPALCNGTFKMNGANEIEFTNSCIWTAEFDWTLILSNKFQFQNNGNNITMIKDYGNGAKDIYILARQ